MRLVTTLRLLIALTLTWALLPYAWARASVVPMIYGHLEISSMLALVGGIASVFVLTWRVRPSMLLTGLARWMPVLIGIVWLCVLATITLIWVVPVPRLAAFVGLFIASSLWVPWVSWLGFSGWPTPRRLVVLVALGLLACVFPTQARVEGLDGEAHVEFAWRSVPRRDGRRTHRETPTVPPLSLGDTSSADSPQFFGPNRSGVYPTLLADWSGDAKPREIWRRNVGSGWSGFAAVGDYAVTQEQIGSDECVNCYRIADGALVWQYATPVRFESILGGDGPRATPTIHNGRVYSVGAAGHLACLDAASGKKVWSVDLLAEFGAKNLEHGICASPLVDGEHVIVSPPGDGGPSLATFDLKSGARLWAAGTDRASYSSPVIWEVDGSRQILLHNSKGLAGHDAVTGKPLWLFNWTNDYSTNCSQPIPNASGPGTVFISTGYAKGGCALVRVKRDGPDRWTTDAAWTGKAVLKTKFTSAVLHDGFAYGLDDGILACVDTATGKFKWKEGRYQHGQVILSGNRLIVVTEGGTLILVEPSPEGLREVGRMPALTSKTWAIPCLVGNRLLVRNDREAICFELPKK